MARAAVVMAITLGLHGRAAAAPYCVGDCIDQGYVSVVDLVRGITISLGTTPLEVCPSLANSAGVVTIDRLITAVGNALHGCPRRRISGEP